MPIENEKTSSERVNIVYKSPGDEGEGKELPFKVLVLGDFTQSEDPVPLSEREPLQITADNLDAVTRALAPKLDLMARETFSGIEKNEIPVSLTFESLKDFQPESLVAKIGPARKVISLRESLLSARQAMDSSAALKNGLKALLSDPEKRARLQKELEAYLKNGKDSPKEDFNRYFA